MEHEHILGRFDKDLTKIQSRIFKMGDLVISQIEDATKALETPDLDAINALVSADRKVNGFNQRIASRAERIIALHQPMALDLRQALAPINLAAEMERIGDHAKTTARRAGKMGAEGLSSPVLDLLRKTSDLLQNQLADALISYRNEDLELAKKVRERDADVDKMTKQLIEVATARLSDTPNQIEPMVQVILIARNLERVGDHVVNMAHIIHNITKGTGLKAND